MWSRSRADNELTVSRSSVTDRPDHGPEGSVEAGASTDRIDAGSGDIRVGDTRGADRVVIGSGGKVAHGRSGGGDQDYHTR